MAESVKLLKVYIITLWNWVKIHLTAFDDNHRPWYFDGYVLKEYLLERLLSRNFTIQFNEMYCRKCGTQVLVVPESVTIHNHGYLDKNSIFRLVKISADCIECSSIVTRFSTDWKTYDLLEYYNISDSSAFELCDTDEAHNTISLRKIIWIIWRTIMPKKYNYQKIRQDGLYTIKKICKVLGVSKSGAKYWVHNCGLEPIDINDRPWLFEGHIVKEFLKKKKDQFKVKLKQGECYCLSCRKGIRVLTESITIEYTGKTLGKNDVAQIIIKGICEVCGGVATRLSSENRKGEFLVYYSDYQEKEEDNLNNQQKV